MTGSGLLVVDSLVDELVAPSDKQVQAERPVPSASVIKERLKHWEGKYAAAKQPATLRAIRADWGMFADWCQRNRRQMLPASHQDLMRYLDDARLSGKKHSTLSRYVNTIRLIHRAASLPDPTLHADWRLDWQALVMKLAHADQYAPRQAEPLRSEHVSQILASLGSSPLDLRDAALVSLASDSLCRESELAKVKLQDIKRSGENFAVDLRKTKTDQEGIGTSRFCSVETKARIDAWCAAASICSGYLFVAIGRSKAITLQTRKNRKALGPTQIARILRRRAIAAGVPEGVLISGHSARVGSCVEMLEAGVSVTDAQLAGGWKSPKMVLHYGKTAMAGQNAMAQLRKKQTPVDPGTVQS